MRYTYTREQIQELHDFLYKNDIYSVEKVENYIKRHKDSVDKQTLSHWLRLWERYKDIMNCELESE